MSTRPDGDRDAVHRQVGQAVSAWVDKHFRDVEGFDRAARAAALTARYMARYDGAMAQKWRIRSSEGDECKAGQCVPWPRRDLRRYLSLFQDDPNSVPTVRIVFGADGQTFSVHRDMMGDSDMIMMVARNTASQDRAYTDVRIPPEVCSSSAVVQTVVLWCYTGKLFNGADTESLGGILDTRLIGDPDTRAYPIDLPFDVWELYALADFLGVQSLLKHLEGVDCIIPGVTQHPRERCLNQYAYIAIRAEQCTGTQSPRMDSGEESFAGGGDGSVSALGKALASHVLRKTGSLNLLARIPFFLGRETWEYWFQRAPPIVHTWSPMPTIVYAMQFLEHHEYDAFFGRLYDSSVQTGFFRGGFSGAWDPRFYYRKETLRAPYQSTPLIHTHPERTLCTPVEHLVEESVAISAALTTALMRQVLSMRAPQTPQWVLEMALECIGVLRKGPAGGPDADKVREQHTLFLTSDELTVWDFAIYEVKRYMAITKDPLVANNTVQHNPRLARVLSIGLRGVAQAESMEMRIARPRKRRRADAAQAGHGAVQYADIDGDD